jgi:four helix bundle protein
MPFKFENLEIWNLAVDYADEVNMTTKKYPKEEMFNLASQFRRAADSISLNIAEGSIGQSNPEQKKFIGYAIRSLAECVNCLYLSGKRKYLSTDEFNTFYKKSEILFAKMNKFKSSPLTMVYGQSSMVFLNL